jgi:guanylate kinase
VLFVVAGPSGCGKSTVIRHALADLRHVHFSVSHTTRPKRDSEREGRDYYFVTRKAFERMIERREFMEWAVVHGNYYGTSKREIALRGRSGDVVLDIDVQGASQVRAKKPEAVFIFILPPSFRELRRRLEKRGVDNAEEMTRRLRVAKKEVRHVASFDFVVVNDRLEKAVSELESIITAARCRLDVRKSAVAKIVKSFQ